MKSVLKNLLISVCIILCASCQGQANAGDNNKNSSNSDQPIAQASLYLNPLNFQSVTVGKTVYGTVQSSAVTSDDVNVRVSTDNNSILQSNCTISKGKSSCTFKITGHSAGSTVLYASAIGYKGDQSKKINVIDIDQLSINVTDSSITVGNILSGSITIPNKNLESNPINVAIQSNDPTIIKDSSCFIQPGESQCDFKLDTQTIGTTEIKALADNYKNSFTQTIKVIDKTQLTITINSSILNLKEKVSGSVKIATPTTLAIPVNINSSIRSTIDNSSCTIQPKKDSCTFELIGIAEGNTNITAAAPNYKDSESKSLQVLNKFQLSVTKFEAHTIGFNSCLQINIKSIVGVEHDLNILLKDTPDSPSPYHSSLCTIKQGLDHCSVDLCSKTTEGEIIIHNSTAKLDSCSEHLCSDTIIAGEMILSASDSNYTIAFPEDISVHVLEPLKLSTDPIIPNGTVMGIKEIKPIKVMIPKPAEADITINVVNTGPGTSGFGGSSCTINKDHQDCSLSLIATNASNGSVTLSTDKIYPGLNLGNITVTNSLVLDVPTPQFIVNQENTVIIKLPAGSPNRPLS